MLFFWFEPKIFTKNHGNKVYNLVQSSGTQEEIMVNISGEIFSIKKQRDLASSYLAVQNKVWNV